MYQESVSHLHKVIHQSQWGYDDGHEGRGHENDHTGAQHIKHGAHEHLYDTGNDWVNGVHLLGEAIHQAPTWGALKEGNGWSQHIMEHALVEIPGG